MNAFADCSFLERVFEVILPADSVMRYHLYRIAVDSREEELAHTGQSKPRDTVETASRRLAFLRFLYGLDATKFELTDQANYTICRGLAGFLKPSSTARELNTLIFLLRKFEFLPPYDVTQLEKGSPVLITLRQGFGSVWALYAAWFASCWQEFRNNGLPVVKLSPLGNARTSDQIKIAIKFLIHNKLVDVRYSCKEVPCFRSDSENEANRRNFWRIFLSCPDQLLPSNETLAGLEEKGFPTPTFTQSRNINAEFASEFARQLGLPTNEIPDFLAQQNIEIEHGVLNNRVHFLRLDPAPQQ